MSLPGKRITTFKQAKRAVKAVLGFTIVLVGLAMIFLPGPAIIVIPIGLAVLASEFLWARRLLDKFKSKFLTKPGKGAGDAQAEERRGGFGNF